MGGGEKQKQGPGSILFRAGWGVELGHVATEALPVDPQLRLGNRALWEVGGGLPICSGVIRQLWIGLIFCYVNRLANYFC